MSSEERLEQLQQLKTKRDQLIAKKAQAEGRRQQVVEAMKERFGVDSLEELKKIRDQKTEERDRCQQELSQKLESFKARWDSVLS
jgi:hypothetical protein